jgi:predicted nucleic acid-binding protein
MVEAHPNHALALPWLQRVKGQDDHGLIAAHSIAELYAVLTTLPVRPPILPAVARQLIVHNVLDRLEVVALTGDDYVALVEHLSKLGIAGGTTYNAVIMRAAQRANADQIVTLNAGDFQRAFPELGERIISPQ